MFDLLTILDRVTADNISGGYSGTDNTLVPLIAVLFILILIIICLVFYIFCLKIKNVKE